MQAYEQALRIRPGQADAHNSLGIASAMQGDLDAAIQHFTEALRLDPNHEKAKKNLAYAKHERTARSSGAER